MNRATIATRVARGAVSELAFRGTHCFDASRGVSWSHERQMQAGETLASSPRLIAGIGARHVMPDHPTPVSESGGWRCGDAFRTMLARTGDGPRREEIGMLFYCGYTWHATTRPETVWERLIHQHERGDNAPELIRGWYDFAGGGAGFLIVDTDDVRELTSMLRPYIDLMTWDIRALSENPYHQTIQQVRDQLAQMDSPASRADASSGREES